MPPRNESLGPQGPAPDTFKTLASIFGPALLGPLGPLESLVNLQRMAQPSPFVGPQQPVSGEAMIPRPGNLEKFNSIKEAIASVLAKSPQKLSPDAIEAMSYMGARYPNRMQTAQSIRPADLPAWNGGYFGHPTKSLDLGPLTKLLDIKVSDPAAKGHVRFNQGFDLEGMIQSLGHETQHSTDYQRKGPEFLLKGRGMNQVKDIIDNLMGRPRNVERYMQLPSEIPAYQAGRTAVEGYKKYDAMGLDDVYNKHISLLGSAKE